MSRFAGNIYGSTWNLFGSESSPRRLSLCWTEVNGGEEKHPCDYDVQSIGQLKRVLACVTSNECNLHSKWIAVWHRAAFVWRAAELKYSVRVGNSNNLVFSYKKMGSTTFEHVWMILGDFLFLLRCAQKIDTTHIFLQIEEKSWA